MSEKKYITYLGIHFPDNFTKMFNSEEARELFNNIQPLESSIVTARYLITKLEEINTHFYYDRRDSGDKHWSDYAKEVGEEVAGWLEQNTLKSNDRP